MAPSRPLPFDPVEAARGHWIANGWESAAAGMAVVTSIMRAHQIFLSQANHVLRPFGLTFARYELLALLSFSRRGSLPLGKIGERLQVAPASVTNAVNRLEADKLIRRVPHPDDGRATLAEITPKGRQVLARATPDLNRVFEAVSLSPGQLDQLFGLIRDLRVGAGDF